MVKSRKPIKRSKSRKHVGYSIKKNRIVKVYCKKSRKTGKLPKSCPKKQRVFSNNKSASRSRLYKKKSTVKKVLKSRKTTKRSRKTKKRSRKTTKRSRKTTKRSRKLKFRMTQEELDNEIYKILISPIPLNQKRTQLKRLSLQTHPDKKGGSEALQKHLNDVLENLKQKEAEAKARAERARAQAERARAERAQAERARARAQAERARAVQPNFPWNNPQTTQPVYKAGRYGGYEPLRIYKGPRDKRAERFWEKYQK